ncbi:MAG: dihydropteroate synthase [Bacteroidota bacterium]|nr:dihydropteroate synthase [Bacteroidota bacterium]
MFTINCRGRLLVIDQPLVMGIINLTPDSFYSGSRFSQTEAILQKAGQMLAEGAAILDIGGQSTRPGSELLTADEEAKRILEPIAAIKDRYPDCIISVDTFYAETAHAAVNAGATIVNDISGGAMDGDMLATVADLDVPYICMHMKGTPQTMQSEAVYKNITVEVLDYFIRKTERCAHAGIKDIIIDPGFGFAKTITHNFQLLRELSVLKMLGKPLLAGLSRKSSVYKTLGITPEESLNGTTVLNTLALHGGASILRVHDVKAAREAIRLFTAVQSA